MMDPNVMIDAQTRGCDLLYLLIEKKVKLLIVDVFLIISSTIRFHVSRNFKGEERIIFKSFR